MTDVFISYRRDDSEGLAGRIFDQLNAAFPGRIIIDIDAIPFGVDFRESITQSLKRCSVLIAVIGPRWFEFEGPDGTRRLDNPNDWVRLEIEAALAHPDVRVIPLLLDDTPMPRAENLPEGFAPLAYRNALRVDSGRDFHHHMGELKGALTTLLATDTPVAAPGPARTVPVPAVTTGQQESAAHHSQPTPTGDSRNGLRISSPSSSVAEMSPTAENVAPPRSLRRLYLLGGVACALLVAGAAAAFIGLYNSGNNPGDQLVTEPALPGPAVGEVHGSGFGPFACPAESALVGIVVGADRNSFDGGAVAYVQGICQALVVSPSGDVSLSGETTLTLASDGAAYTGPPDVKSTCPASAVVTGFHGRRGVIYDALGAVCTRLAATGAPAGLSTNLTAVPGTGGKDVGTQSCPENSFAAGIQGRMGDQLFQFQLNCIYVYLVPARP